jgi:hypothetical protein
MSRFDTAKAVPGGMLSRQMSTSHVTPRSLSGYQDFFRQNSNPENGFLSLRVGKTGQYEERYVAFEDSTLSVYASPGSPKLFSISMDAVVSFRTDVSDPLPLVLAMRHPLTISSSFYRPMPPGRRQSPSIPQKIKLC